MIVTMERDVSSKSRRMHKLLLAYLYEANAPAWPGADGVTVEEVLLSYPECAEAGLVPDLPTLVQNHPELADVLRDFFAD
jgi:hypothetical protein